MEPDRIQSCGSPRGTPLPTGGSSADAPRKGVYGDGNAAILSLALKRRVYLHVTFGRHEILLCGLAREGLARGGERAAVMYTLIGTAKLNDVDPQAWLADVLARIAEMPQTRLPELLPWHWKADREQALAA